MGLILMRIYRRYKVVRTYNLIYGVLCDWHSGEIVRLVHIMYFIALSLSHFLQFFFMLLEVLRIIGISAFFGSALP